MASEESSEETSASVDDETLAHLERLARLEVPADERESLKADLSTVLAFVAQIGELSLESEDSVGDTPGSTRPDVPRPGLGQAAALSVAPASRDGYFEVPRTLDEG